LLANARRAIKVALLTFCISLIISLLAQFSLALWLSVAILFLVVLTGIFFDIIGTAVTAADESPFHAMAADKVHGSRQAIYLIRHADKVANFCNDVVGDIAGTLSGAMIAAIIIQIIRHNVHPAETIIGSAAVAFIAALTVGGKAFGKSFAIREADQIVSAVGRLLSFISFFDLGTQKARNNRKNASRKAKKSTNGRITANHSKPRRSKKA
jgi:CBS domain containing-hemolysin-like protein